MKKLFALLLALMMVFALAACGESKTTDSDKDSSTASRSDDGSVNRAENSTDNGGNEDDGDVGSKEDCAFCFDIEGSDQSATTAAIGCIPTERCGHRTFRQI